MWVHTCEYKYNMYSSFHCLQGSAIQIDPCAAATATVQGVNDNCSRAIQQLFGGGAGSLIDLYLGDCPTRFQAYASTCSEQFGNSSDEVSTCNIATSLRFVSA